MPRMGTCKNKECTKCGQPAEVKYRNEWYCGPCLNPEPTTDYLRMERERVLGQWGNIHVDMWDKM